MKAKGEHDDVRDGCGLVGIDEESAQSDLEKDALTSQGLGGDDVDPGNRSRVNESLHPARLGRGHHHETHQAHSGADHPQALARRASGKQWDFAEGNF